MDEKAVYASIPHAHLFKLLPVELFSQVYLLVPGSRQTVVACVQSSGTSFWTCLAKHITCISCVA